MDSALSPSRYWDPRRELLPYLPPGATSVLDVGCAEGAFDAELRRLRPDLRIVGLDPTVVADAVPAGVFDSFITGRYPEDVPPGETFDCVFFNDVLEHLEDPWRALREVAGVVSPDGHVVASLPNVRHLSISLSLLVRGRFDYRDTGILDRTHLRFFTRRSMQQLFDDSGLTILRLDPIQFTAWQTRAPRNSWERLRRGVRTRIVRYLGPLAPELFARRYVVVAHLPGCRCRG